MADRVALVGLAAEFAESRRRLENDRQRTDRLARLQADEADTAQQFAAISSQWDAAASHAQAEDLKASLDALRAECSSLLQQKVRKEEGGGVGGEEGEER